MANKRRTYRVGEKVHAIVARELQKVADPRFSMVTVSSVVVSSDLRYTKVYWVVSGGQERIAEVTEAFEHAQGRFRRAIASELGVKFVPELRFFYDDTLDTVDEVERLFEKIKSQE